MEPVWTKYPRPWKAQEELLLDANEQSVAIVNGRGTWKDDASLAAFIVERVNAAEAADLGGE